MSMKHYPYPSIEQFRHVVKTVRDRCTFHQYPPPKLKFYGFVKLHGTNAGVVWRGGNDVYALSRSRVITPESDNAGFAKFVADNAEDLAGIAGTLGEAPLVMYGEWIGEGVQKGVAVSALPRRFVVFDVMDASENEDRPRHAPHQTASMTFGLSQMSASIWPISDFGHYEIEIDFANPELAQNELVRLTAQVEAECPAGKFFGVSGVGEGIVWRCCDADVPFRTHDLRFKVKGEKHSDSRVKVLAVVDDEAIQSMKVFAERVCTHHRLSKGVDALRDELATEPGSKHTGQFIGWVCRDVLKEEADVIEHAGFDWKMLSKYVTTNARQWYLARA